MSYKSILVHADQSQHAATRFQVAAEIAIAEGAHLIGTAMSGISRYVYQANAYGVGSPISAVQIDELYAYAQSSLESFEKAADRAGVLSYEKRLIDDDPESGLVLQARYSDLVVVSQSDPDEPFARLLSDLPEYVMLNCARPVLVVPYAGRFESVGTNALIAWDGSMEATRAITAAIPLLRRARSATLAVFNPSARYEVHGDQPGADIALFLARHDVKVNVLQQITDMDVGNSLLSLCADLGSDLIVMGGYGHTRFRELLLGGVTKTILETMTVPVLMAH